jgi:hypothetical protein
VLTLEEYKTQFPNAKNWGSWANLMQPGVRLIVEGMLLFTPETAPCWGGPFEGGYAQFIIRDYTNATVIGGPNIKRKAAADRNIFGLNSFTKYKEDPSLEFPIKLSMETTTHLMASVIVQSKRR